MKLNVSLWASTTKDCQKTDKASILLVEEGARL
jgi:hypothetical protein